LRDFRHAILKLMVCFGRGAGAMNEPITQQDVIRENAQRLIEAADELKLALAANDLLRVRECNRKLDDASGLLATDFMRLAQYEPQFR
jgi:hypothetical protein